MKTKSGSDTISPRDTEEWYTPEINRQTWVRIRLSLAAYAYEVLSDPIMSDGEFDELAKEVDLSIDTRRPDLDKWFRKNYVEFSGGWIWSHPEKERLEGILESVFNKILVRYF